MTTLKRKTRATKGKIIGVPSQESVADGDLQAVVEDVPS